MYIPQAFREDDINKLQAFMREANFAVIVSLQDGIPVASHLPFMLDSKQGQYGTLIGHMARANEQWKTFAAVSEVLVIFQGAHAYISPSWYEAELSVPTWNFVAVHAYGTPCIVDDEQVIYQLLAAQVKEYEAGFTQPWSFVLPDRYVQGMMRGIIAFKIEITRLEGKYKLSQNRSANDRNHVIAALRENQDIESMRIADLMEEGL